MTAPEGGPGGGMSDEILIEVKGLKMYFPVTEGSSLPAPWPR